MFKKTIKYKNFNGEEKEKDFYFHLSKGDLVALGADNSLEQRISRMMATNDGPNILKEFKEIIRLAVGVRSDDGETFDKSPEAQAALMSSPAFDELLMELITNAGAAESFIKNLIPTDMRNELLKQIGSSNNPFAEQEDKRPAWIREHRNPTNEELRNASQEELRMAFKVRNGE